MKPGVGYQVQPGAVSHAGDGHGFPPSPLNLTADPWAGRDPRTTAVDQTAMTGRYGPHWQAGVSGPHSNVYEDSLREKFASRTATWPVQYEEWDGIPIGREVNDAFFSKDPRVNATTTGNCQQQLAATRQQLTATQQALTTAQQDLATARQALDASRGQVTALTADVESLNARVHALKEVPEDITKTVTVLRNAGPQLEIKTGLKAAIRRLEQWVLKRRTI